MTGECYYYGEITLKFTLINNTLDRKLIPADSINFTGMKYVISIVALAAVTLTSISASAQRTIVTVAGQALHSREMPPVYQIPLENVQPFLSYFVIWEAPVYRSLEIRFSSDAHSWTIWQRLEQDEHSPDLPISTRGSTAAEHRYFQLRGIPPDISVQCHFYSPGSSEVITPSDSEVIT